MAYIPVNAKERLSEIVQIAYERLCGKITGQRIVVSNEASLQLQFSGILKTIGELYEESPNERFNIELEKSVLLPNGIFSKSKSARAKIDIWFSLENVESGEGHSCAIELKYFKKANFREPNNRYDLFKDLHNLENYGEFADIGYMLVATDSQHYINQAAYSEETADFDFRNGRKYQAGTRLTYRTSVPYGPPISLSGNYEFSWLEVEKGLNFMFVKVIPRK